MDFFCLYCCSKSRCSFLKAATGLLLVFLCTDYNCKKENWCLFYFKAPFVSYFSCRVSKFFTVTQPTFLHPISLLLYHSTHLFFLFLILPFPSSNEEKIFYQWGRRNYRTGDDDLKYPVKLFGPIRYKVVEHYSCKISSSSISVTTAFPSHRYQNEWNRSTNRYFDKQVFYETQLEACE